MHREIKKNLATANVSRLPEAHGAMPGWTRARQKFPKARRVGDEQPRSPVAAQLMLEYTEANGVRLPSRRRAYTRGPDRRPILDMLMVSMEISDVAFS